MTRRDRKQHDERAARHAVAAEWMETLKSAERRDHAAFDEWLRESKLNVESYLELEALDRQIRALDARLRPDIEAIAAQTQATVQPLRTSNETRSRSRISNVPWKRIGLAAAVVLAVTAGLFAHRTLLSTDPRSARTLSEEQRTLTLSDGSVVRMNVDTALAIDYETDRRLIRLQSGEAIFTVTTDPARPFVVETPTATIRALGTQFNVYQRRETVVSVIEGRVQLTTWGQGSAPSSQTIQRLIAGEQAEVTRGRILRHPHANVARAIAWRKHQQYFANATLEDIVSEFNRNSSVKIALEDVPRGTYRFGGTFNVDDPESLADILAQERDLIVERSGEQIVVRTRK